MAASDEKTALATARTALALYDKGQEAAAKARLLEAWQLAPLSTKVLTVVAGTFVDVGDQEAALELLQQSLALQGETEELLSLMAVLAMRMETPEIAEKVYRRLADLKPDRADYRSGLVEALRKSGREDEAVEVARLALGEFPASAELWNAIGVLALTHLRDMPTARMFFAEAVEHAPKSAIYRYNLAMATAGEPELTEANLRKALALDPENAQIHVTYGLFLLGAGRCREAWRHYGYRHKPELGYSKTAHYTHGLKEWRGQSLKGKSIFLCAEQGVGDEILFALTYRRFLKEADKVYIGCDPRLVSLFHRSFPGAVVAGFEDSRHYQRRLRSFPEIEAMMAAGTSIDYAIPAGNAFHYWVQDYADLTGFEVGYIKSDPDLSVAFGEQVAAMATGKRLRIGVSWRSGNMALERKHYYLSLGFIVALARAADADVYVLQHSMTPEEHAALSAEPNVHLFDGLDLKADIEANYAIMDHLDLVLGPPVATQSFAMSHGVPVWIYNKGLPWTQFGRMDMPPYYHEASRFWDTERYLDQGVAMEALVEASVKALNLSAADLAAVKKPEGV